MDDAGAGGFGGFLVRVDHTMHPLGFTGQVAVIRAIGSAGGHTGKEPYLA